MNFHVLVFYKNRSRPTETRMCMGNVTYSPLQSSAAKSDISVCQWDYFRNCHFL